MVWGKCIILLSDLHRTGLVESKIRILIGKLEYNSGIELAHVNCKTFNHEAVMYVILPVYCVFVF